MLAASRDSDLLRISLPSHPRLNNFAPSTTHSSPSHIAANRQFFQHLPHASSTPSPSDATGKQNYFDRSNEQSSSTPAIVYDTSDVPISNIDLFMSPSYDFQSSQQSTFNMPLTEAQPSVYWSQLGGNNAMGGVANSMGVVSRGGQNHQRVPSTSSIGSTSSQSPFQGQRSRALDATSQKSRSIGRRQHVRTQSTSSRSHLPTPSQTPTRNVFLSPSNSTFGQQSQDISSSLNQHILEQGDDEVPQMSRSARPSFSSVNQDPATPMTAVSDHPEEHSRGMQNDLMSAGVPKLERTVSDAYNDTIWFPQMTASAQAASNSNFLMPNGANNIIHDRLLEAQMARTSSTGSNQSGALSPYHQQRLRSQDPSSDLQYQMSPHTESETKTISPKEAMLDYKPEADEAALFPQSQAAFPQFNAIASPSVNRQQQLHQQSSMNFGNLLPTSQAAWTSGMPQTTLSNAQSFNAFATPQIPGGIMNMSGLQQWPSSAQSQRSFVRQQTEQNPEFPAQLTSMDSSASEAAPPSSQASSSIVISPKPDSAADSGTYSCTFQNCFQRFNTPQRLQRHKRDHHRANPHVTPGVGSGMSTQELLERNSQSGPHKCQRTNPTTGKPCNQIFSRPYDLTRHEDTIHNIRKQKVRCAICTEEKTFSRSDALTRHMRVVHPEIEFPGKHRKRGSRGD